MLAKNVEHRWDQSSCYIVEFFSICRVRMINIEKYAAGMSIWTTLTVSVQ